MPPTRVVIYCEQEDQVSLLDWLDSLQVKAQDKRAVPPKEIDRAVERKKKFESDPKRHTLEQR